MATAEKPTLRMQPHDEAIFVASDSRRARHLGRAAALTAFLAVLWVVGLGIGMLGFGHLPGVPFVNGARAESPVAPIADVSAAAERDAARALLTARSAQAALHSAAPAGHAQATAKRRTAAQKAAAAAARPAAQPAAAVNPAQRTRGWARKGNQAPPGQARRAVRQPPPPPATSKGRRVGQTTTTPKPVVPPGQAKKALEPPPPPPPPKKG
jgi:hypothetical protein